MKKVNLFFTKQSEFTSGFWSAWNPISKTIAGSPDSDVFWRICGLRVNVGAPCGTTIGFII